MNRPNERSGITLIVDRLSAGALGPYGNTWIETPGFNRWGAEGLVVDWMMIDSPRLDVVYRSYWQGNHARTELPSMPGDSLVAKVRKQGVHCLLITDDSNIAATEAAGDFSEIVTVPCYETHLAANEFSETQLAKFFLTALECLENCRPPYWIWIHSRGMSGAWDAPYSLRAQYADEGDPAPPRFVATPSERLPARVDPDVLLGMQQSYAAQVNVLDECVGLVLDALQSIEPNLRPFTLLTSPRGFPLGLHGSVGEACQNLRTDLCHVPCLLVWPDHQSASRRLSHISQPPDVAASFAEWFGVGDWQGRWGVPLLPSSTASIGLRNWGACFSDDHSMIRTPAWLMICDRTGDTALFTKPDDRWDINEVGNRCRSETAALQDALVAFERAAAIGDRTLLPELPAELQRQLE